MRHIIKPPPPELAHIVKYFWSFEWQQECREQLQISTFVNDSTGMTFVLNKNNPLFRASVEGQSTQPKVFAPVPSVHAIGVQFLPGVMATLFGFKASEFTDQDIALADISGYNIADAILDACDFDTRVDLLSNYLLHLGAGKHGDDKLVLDCIRKITGPAGFASVSAIRQHYGISERQLERRFSAAVGVSPRHYMKITRFQKVLCDLKSNPRVKLTELAIEYGYFDQAHFIKDVKQFTGFTPKELHRKLVRLPVNQRGSTSYLLDIV